MLFVKNLDDNIFCFKIFNSIENLLKFFKSFLIKKLLLILRRCCRVVLEIFMIKVINLINYNKENEFLFFKKEEEFYFSFLLYIFVRIKILCVFKKKVICNIFNKFNICFI